MVIGFYVYHRSCELGSPVIVVFGTNIGVLAVASVFPFVVNIEACTIRLEVYDTGFLVYGRFFLRGA